MKNKLGKEIKIYNAKEIDFGLKYQWKEGAAVPCKDEDKCMAFYECPFDDIPMTPGIYLFCFPEGQFYLGQAKNLAARFTQHFYNFYSPKCQDWHSSIDGLKSWKKTKNYIWKYCTYFYMELDENQLDLYEQSALAQIVNRGMTEKYYNTIFYKQEEDKND